MSEEASNLALAPMVRFFTYAVIKSMKNKNLEHRKFVIDTEMVPRVSQRVFQASLGQRVSTPEHLQPKLEESDQKQDSNKGLIQSFDQNSAPIPNSQNTSQINNISPNSNSPAPQLKTENHSQAPTPQLKTENHSQSPAPQNMMPPAPRPPAPAPQGMMPPAPRPPVPQGMPPPSVQGDMPPPPEDSQEELTQFYGKITPLLNDPSVSVIECQGQGKPVMIVRGGHKQPTRIILSEKDISQILEKVSEVAHIPIMEGVFRAAVDTFNINAVISEMIGSRFVIRKIHGQGPMSPPPMGMPPR